MPVFIRKEHLLRSKLAESLPKLRRNFAPDVVIGRKRFRRLPVLTDVKTGGFLLSLKKVVKCFFFLIYARSSVTFKKYTELVVC